MGRETKKYRERGNDAHVCTVMFTKYQLSLHERKTERRACDVQKISIVCVWKQVETVWRESVLFLCVRPYVCVCVLGLSLLIWNSKLLNHRGIKQTNIWSVMIWVAACTPVGSVHEMSLWSIAWPASLTGNRVNQPPQWRSMTPNYGK